MIHVYGCDGYYTGFEWACGAPKSAINHKRPIMTSSLESRSPRTLSVAGVLVSLLLVLAACRSEPKPEPTPSSPAQLLEQPWKQLTEAARGSRVNLFMWGGDSDYNRYVDDYAAPALKQAYDIELHRVVIGGSEEIINKLLAEKSAGRSRGTVDLLWANGQAFAIGAEAGLWAENWACDLPNAALIDWSNPAINRDFGYPVECREAPWSQAQLVLIYDSTEVTEPPTSPAALLQWVQNHPGRFTYPAPPDFTGTAFMAQALLQLTGDDFQRPYDAEQFGPKTSALWHYLQTLAPHLWRSGETYPASVQKLNELYANGEVAMSLSYNPQFAQRQIHKGIFPETTRTALFEPGSLHNNSYLALAFNAPNPAGALVVANFMQSPEAQAAKLDPKRLGALSVLDPERLSPEQRKLLNQHRGPASLSAEQVRRQRLSEPFHGWIKPLQDHWRKTLARTENTW